ncbi:MAG: hypothetical protein ACR2MB_15845, partial [Acidimicrobiales bacterium]
MADGSDAKTLRTLRRAVEAEGAELAPVAPTVGGVTDSDGAELAIDEKSTVARRSSSTRLPWCSAPTQ